MDVKQHINIELRHIELEMRSGRFQYLRHFIDPYYCYANGIIRPSGKISTDDVMWRNNISVEAKKLEEDIGDYSKLRKLVRKEHIVPLRFITKKLKEISQSDFSLQDIQHCLDKYVHFATITKQEDTELNRLGYNSKMPEEFFDPKHELFADIYARYKMAGIELID